MKVYIVRHGKAEADSSTGLDSDRLLAARGVQQARFLGEQIQRSPHAPALILSSPVTRALETARIIHSLVPARFETCDTLRVDEPVSGALRTLARHAFPEKGDTPPCIMLVGHNPQVSELCEVLANGIGASRCSFRTGEAVLLEVDRESLIGSGKLLAQLRLDSECGTFGS